MRSSGTDDSRTARMRALFALEEERALELSARVRLFAVFVLTVWITIENRFPEVLYFYGYAVVFALLSLAPLALHRRRGEVRWARYVFPLLDVSLITLAILVPNPLQDDVFPIQMILRFGNELYLFIFIAGAVFTYSPAAVLWTGFAAAAVWSLGTLWIYLLPDSLGLLSDRVLDTMSAQERVAAAIDPHRIYVGMWGRQIVIYLLTSAVLAAFVWRARRLVVRQAAAERERANLSRYFSPRVVDQLAQADEPLRATRRQEIAVLFADMVGFTTLSEHLSPDSVIDLLREFHRRMEQMVFAHDGTLDKYIGDGLMATFGTPRRGPHDAANALRCARQMIQAVDEWNAQRAGGGLPPVRIGVGVHYGPVVMGDIGTERHLEFTVVGDTVNVASRLERLTRTLSTPLVASDAAIEAARSEVRSDDAMFSAFAPVSAQRLRGRSEPLGVWQWGGGAA